MSSERIKHLQNVFNAFNPASVPADGTFLPDEESYPALFANGDEGKSMRSALRDATGPDLADFPPARVEKEMQIDFSLWKAIGDTGRLDYDLYEKVRAEFYDMVENLERALNSLEGAVDGPDGLVETANGLIGLKENAMNLLKEMIASLAIYNNSKFDIEKSETEAPVVLDPRILLEAFANVRELKGRLSAIEGALEKSSGLGKTGERDKLIAHMSLFSPPYGNNGKILSENLPKVTAWYMNHKKNREILSEAYQHELTALGKDQFFQNSGFPGWTQYTFEYLRRNPAVTFEVMNMAWLSEIPGFNYWARRELEDGLARFVTDMEAAQVVDGQVKYPENSQDVTKFDKLVRDGHAYGGIPIYIDDKVRICMLVAKLESLRKAMLREADIEDERKDASEVFQKLCRCQQESYAFASELGNGMIRLMKFIDDVLRPGVLDMASTVDDMYCNLIAEDFGSALEDWAAFGEAYEKFQDDFNSFNRMFS